VAALSRRAFLGRLGGGVAAPFIVARSSSAKTLARRYALGNSISPLAIRHVVVVMMENRSFDHLLGWLPGADGRQAGLRYPDRNGHLVATHHLKTYQACASADPTHSFQGGREEYDYGRCDGFLRAERNDSYAIGYYSQADLPFLGQAAPRWTVCDRYFSAIMAGTVANRMYLHAGATDRLAGITPISTLQTIWDALGHGGVSGRYYFSDVPFLGLWGAKYRSIMHTHRRFLEDCASGELPAVAYVDPRFVGEHQGIANDDHPHADIRAGEYFLNQAYEAVVRSPSWPHTVMVIAFDEWGGFFDHVPPPPGAARDPHHRLRGFRVPCLVISPFARRRYVDHRLFDHASILRMIEWRWRLRPLAVRDAHATNLALTLDLSRASTAAPRFSVPTFRAGAAC
jgi:phospholipase C